MSSPEKKDKQPLYIALTGLTVAVISGLSEVANSHPSLIADLLIIFGLVYAVWDGALYLSGPKDH